MTETLQQPPEPVPERNQLFKLPIATYICGALSVLWIAFSMYCGVYFYYSHNTQEMNNWGDFIAGFISPVAFFWLIYGYYLNTRALVAQEKELNRQNDETAELIKTMRQQVEATNRQATAIENQLIGEKEERKRLEKKAEEDLLPEFVFHSPIKKMSAEYAFDIQNFGGRVTDISIESLTPNIEIFISYMIEIYKERMGRIIFRSNGFPFIYKINFRDIKNNKKTLFYMMNSGEDFHKISEEEAKQIISGYPKPSSGFPVDLGT